MPQTIVMMLLAAGLAGFMAYQLYSLARRRTLRSRGVEYSFERHPVRLWIVTAIAAFGLLAGVALFLLIGATLVSST